MKRNFSILVMILLISGVVIGLVASLFLSKGPAKKMLTYISLALMVAGFLQIMLYTMKPAWFRDKQKSDQV